MVRITPTQGHFDTSLDTMATKLRAPVFVDNALHYAKVESSSEGNKVTIENNNAENYDLATEKAYSVVVVVLPSSLLVSSVAPYSSGVVVFLPLLPYMALLRLCPSVSRCVR